MGRDKAVLRYHGEPQVVRAWRLLREVCGEAVVSVDSGRAGTPLYAGLPAVVDEGGRRGPIAGLEAAWAVDPEAAWLLLAVDMPFVDRSVLQRLVAARDPSAYATAFRHDDGTPEPLCAIWEPAAREPLLVQLRGGDASLRRFLERHGFRAVRPAEESQLMSVDDPEAYAEIVGRHDER